MTIWPAFVANRRTGYVRTTTSSGPGCPAGLAHPQASACPRTAEEPTAFPIAYHPATPGLMACNRSRANDRSELKLPLPFAAPIFAPSECRCCHPTKVLGSNRSFWPKEANVPWHAPAICKRARQGAAHRHLARSYAAAWPDFALPVTPSWVIATR